MAPQHLLEVVHIRFELVVKIFLVDRPVLERVGEVVEASYWLVQEHHEGLDQEGT